MTAQVIYGYNDAEYQKVLAAWKVDTEQQMAAYMNSVGGAGVFTFEMFYKFRALLQWGIIMPLPWQVGYDDTPKNRDAFIHNVDAFYDAMKAGNLNNLQAVGYTDAADTSLNEAPMFVLLKKTSRFAKFVKIAVIVAAAVMVGAACVAMMTAGTPAAAAAAATTTTASVTAVTVPTVAAAGTTTAAVTATAAAATSATSSLTLASIGAAIKTGAVWVAKTAATVVASNAASNYVKDKEMEKQQRAAEAEARQMAADQAEIDAMKAKTAALQQQNDGSDKPFYTNPLFLTASAIAVKLLFF